MRFILNYRIRIVVEYEKGIHIVNNVFNERMKNRSCLRRL